MESKASGLPGHSSRNEEVIEKVCQIVMEDRRLTLREIVEEVGISRGSFHSILTKDLCIWRVMLCEESGQTCGQGRSGSFPITILLLISPM